MKRIFRILIVTILYVFYKVAALFYREKGTVVLMYHSIGNNEGPLVVTPENFERQLKYLKKNYSEKFLVTFDDGYKDFQTVAWPILKKHGLSAILFVHTNRSSHNLGNDWPLLDWQQIKELKSDGVEVGNHSHQHLDMKQLNGEELKREIILSEEIFRQELGEVPKVFAYPGGKYNSRVIEFLKQRGYEKAYTIDEGIFRRGDDPLRIKRIGVSGQTSMLEFKIMLTPAFEWYQTLRKLFGLKK